MWAIYTRFYSINAKNIILQPVLIQVVHIVSFTCQQAVVLFQGDFDFSVVYSDDFEETELPKDATPCSRFQWGKHLMEKFSEGGKYVL